MKKLLKTLSLLLLLFCFKQVFAESLSDNDPTSSSRPVFRVFTDREGIPQNTIHSITVDSRGYLWVGTEDGAAYYNGNKWAVVNMPSPTISNFVRVVLGTSDGSIWFGKQDGGLSQLKGGRWYNFDLSNGLRSNRVNALLETKEVDGSHTLWVATHNGISQLNSGKWKYFDKSSGLPDDRVWCLIESRNDAGESVIFAGTDRGIAKYQKQTWAIVETGLTLSSKEIYSLLETKSTNGKKALWVGTFGSGLLCYENGIWTVFDTSKGLSNNFITRLMETRSADGTRAVWAATYTGGLIRYENGQWTTFDTNSGLPSNSIQSLFSTLSWDGTPTIWIGTRSSGLVRWEKGRWTAFDVKNNLPNRVVTALLETQEKTGYKYWFGTMTGLASLSNGQWRLLDTSSGLPNNSVTALLKSASDNNNYVLWVGTDGGLGRLKDEKWTTYDTSSGLPSNNILSLLETANSNGGNILWIGTREGLAHSSSRKGRPFDTVLGLPKLAVYSLVETTTSNSRAVWVGTESGLWKLENGRWTVFNTSAGLPNNSVECLTEVRFQNGKRQLWAGTLGGVAILDLNVKFPKWQILAVKLPDSAIHKIVQGKDLKVYLFTNKGIVCLNENPSTEFDVYTFTNEDGLPSNESTGAGFVDFKGRIWAGTVGGAALFSPDRLVIDKTPKPLYVEKMTVNNSSVNFQEPIALSYDQNRISFDYALISYYRESGTLYQTQLVGFENDPTEWSSDSKREFAGLQAGDYIFKVWGKDYAGNLSGPYSVEFTIKPPPWATWWAYFIYVSAITGIVYLRIKLRLRSLAQRNRLLEAKVSARTMELETALNQLRVSEREARYAKELSIESEKRAIEASRAKSIFLASMSHELRTPLNAVLGFVQLMERAPDRTADDQAYLSIINRSGEHLLSLINDVLSVSKIEAGQLTLNQQPFDIHRLLNWVEEIFAYRADEKGLKLCFEISSNLPRYVLGDEGKLRQILINLLGNAIKFTERGGIVLKVDWQTGQAKFEIEDTGYGIAEDEIGKLFEAFVQTSSGQRAKEGTGLGLVISQNFVNLMGGDIRVKSRLGEGTLFSFDINLPQAESIDEQVKKPKVVGLVSRQKEFRILVADDIIENRKILVSMLSSVGFTVSEAVNGREAVEIWAKWHPDLIWMDVRMPEIDGITATRIIRSFEDGKAIPEYKDMLANYKNRGPRVCIIALTASIFHHDRDSMASAGCDDYVPKPYHEETIFKKMEEHLGVRYVYEKIDEVEKFEKKSRLAELVQQSNIPTEILTSLKESVMIGDVDEANRQVEKIESYDSQFAAELKLMLKSYKLNEIIALAGK